MIKFLLSLPLALFVGAQVFVVYRLGDIIFRAANENAAPEYIGDWSFWQIVLAMVGIIIAIILASFLYAMVVLKPVFYPPPAPPEKKPGAARPKPEQPVHLYAAAPMNFSARPAPYAAGAASQPHLAGMYPMHSMGGMRDEYEPEKRGVKRLVALIIAGIIIAGLGVAGFIFREHISDFIGGFARSDEPEEIHGELYEEEQYGPEEYEQLPPEVPAGLYFTDLLRGWTIFYPAGLELNALHPFDEWAAVRAPSYQMLYWSVANEGEYINAAMFAAIDSGGLFEAAADYRVVSESVAVARFEHENYDGDAYFSVRLWHVAPEGVASVEIAVETEELAVEWLESMAAGAVYILMNAEPPEYYQPEEYEPEEDTGEED